LANEITIPALPCRSIDETLAFYVALGFEITYHEARFNYGVVKYEDINLHFFSMKGYEPKDSYTTCLVLVPDLVALHGVFTTNIRAQLGKVPVAGIPRISKLNNSNRDHQWRFNVVDPGGNWVRFIQKGEQPDLSDKPEEEGQTKLSRATAAADYQIEAFGDFAKAAQLLDKALADEQAAPTVHRIRALVLRASLAISLDDHTLARKLLSDVRQIPLEAQEREALAAELQRADDLQGMID
jgi:catechol 2,3-dioxygenase-like lactoylglutathione lyase family enzyme